MGPKKGKKKGKGKKKKAAGLVDNADPIEKNWIMQAEAEAL